MAETITRQLREPFVESAGLGITNEGLRLLKDQIVGLNPHENYKNMDI